ncbi:ParB N-terminal domain-containing protein [Bacillus cereus group sp. BC10]
MIQPIVVRPHGHDYQIVAGERRWRAAQRARLH